MVPHIASETEVSQVKDECLLLKRPKGSVTTGIKFFKSKQIVVV